jgi:hypothetical protein
MHIAFGSVWPGRALADRPTRVSGGLVWALALAVSLGPALAGKIVAGDTAGGTASAIVTIVILPPVPIPYL